MVFILRRSGDMVVLCTSKVNKTTPKAITRNKSRSGPKGMGKLSTNARLTAPRKSPQLRICCQLRGMGSETRLTNQLKPYTTMERATNTARIAHKIGCQEASKAVILTDNHNNRKISELARKAQYSQKLKITMRLVGLMPCGLILPFTSPATSTARTPLTPSFSASR